eukprot:scaffold122932_cov28-Tisochrysis_lutea.AAC.2
MSRLTQRLAPPLCGRSLSIGTAKERALSLEGQVAWVVGGVGIVGAGICRGLLRAGATVLVNSRHETRLEQLADELGHPEQLVCVTGSMLPEHAAATITAGLDRTSQQLDHVVAHCAVRWWARNHGDETSTVLRNANSLLSIAPEEFPALASQLASLHFAAAHHLVPRLSQERSSYTFMTGGGPSQMRSVPGTLSSLGHVNAAVVSGLAGAMRSELSGSSLRVSELRVRTAAPATACRALGHPVIKFSFLPITSACRCRCASTAPRQNASLIRERHHCLTSSAQCARVLQLTREGEARMATCCTRCAQTQTSRRCESGTQLPMLATPFTSTQVCSERSRSLPPQVHFKELAFVE